MKIKELFPVNERVDRIVYVVQHKDDELANEIFECKVNAEHIAYNEGFKHLWGTLRPAKPFKSGGEFQVFRLTNDPRCTGGGMRPKEFEAMLNSDYFHFYDFYVYTTKEAAENHVKRIIEHTISILEDQIKTIKHIDYIQYID